jgi:hypothetical protein
MAFASSSSALSVALSLTTLLLAVSEKLNCTNHQSWKAQVLVALRGTQLTDGLDANVVPPEAFAEEETR